MCGILGWYAVDGIGPHLKSFIQGTQVAAHRGPDGEGYLFVDQNNNRQLFTNKMDPDGDYQQVRTSKIAISHRRLSIIDLSDDAAQPLSNASKTIWITYNGEIYNYIELREELRSLGHQFTTTSDTEVLLRAYEEWGAECTNKLSGMWAFAVVDLEKNIIFCSRDRFGIKPFYYYLTKNHFIFASEIKQLLEFPFVKRDVNPKIVYDFLIYSALDYCEETFFSGIKRLMQGHNLVFDLASHQVNIRKYYDPSFSIDSKITFKGAVEKYRHLLFDSVKMHLRSDVEVGSCLSGGIDSSSLVCTIHDLLKQQNKNDIQRTFSSHFDDADANELEYMNAVIDSTGVTADFIYPNVEDLLNDAEKIAWHQDEPFGSTSIFAQWSVFQLVKQKNVKVMIDGQGADEQLGGYLGYAGVFFQELAMKKMYPRFAWELANHARFNPQTWFERTNTTNQLALRWGLKQPYPQTKWISESFANDNQLPSAWQQLTSLKPFGDSELLNNVLYQHTFFTNIQALLRFEDRDSMAFSVESRVPFLDHRLVEFLFTLPSTFKIRDGYTKRVLRESMRGVIPDKIRLRTSKLGFSTPERTWRKKSLSQLLESALASGLLDDYLDPQAARAYYQEVNNRNLFDSTFWKWISLYLWRKVYSV
jgi:asparagine synthase (glutamine-hydrolysing)